MRVCSAKQVHFSGCSNYSACLRAALTGCTSASVLTIWQRKAGALQRVSLPFGMRVCSAERMHLSGCSYHLARVCAVLSGCTSAGVLSIWPACVQRKAGALPGVFLPFGMRVCSAERMHFSGCSYHLACVWQRKAGALQQVFLPYGMRVCSAERCTSAGVLTNSACKCAAQSGCCTLSALRAGMPNGKNTRSSAPAQAKQQTTQSTKAADFKFHWDRTCVQPVLWLLAAHVSLPCVLTRTKLARFYSEMS